MILIPVSITLAVLGLLACIWSIRQGQLDDLETPRWKILFDNHGHQIEKSENKTEEGE